MSSCPRCGLTSEGDLAQCASDLRSDQDPATRELMRHVFDNPKGRQALAVLVARSFFFHPEIATARQLSLRNGAGIMLNQLGIGSTVESITAMIEAGLKSAPKEKPSE